VRVPMRVPARLCMVQFVAVRHERERAGLQGFSASGSSSPFVLTDF
jgi:hypothetical protein